MSFAGAATAHAQSTQGQTTRAPVDASSVAGQVDVLLGLGIESSTPARAYAALGEPGTRALISAFERESAPRYIRLRALSALSALAAQDDELATRYLLTLLSAQDKERKTHLGSLAPARSGLVMRRTLRGLERHHRRVSAADVVPYLSHPDAGVRAAAVRLLARKEEPGVADMLRARGREERSREVLTALAEAGVTPREPDAEAVKDRSAPPVTPRPDARGSDSPPR
jgi:hypothetical protein